MDARKAAAVTAAVLLFMEEEARAAEERRERRPPPGPSPWSLSGRQAIMQNRFLVTFRVIRG